MTREDDQQEEQQQETGAEIHRTATIWEDAGGKEGIVDGHQVTGVSAGDLLSNGPPRVKVTEEDVRTSIYPSKFGVGFYDG